MSNIQMSEARELRIKWLNNGNLPCNHVFLSKEYYLSSDTGDYACDDCGLSKLGNKWNKNKD